MTPASDDEAISALNQAVKDEALKLLRSYDLVFQKVAEELSATDGVDRRLVAMGRTQIELGLLALEKSLRAKVA